MKYLLITLLLQVVDLTHAQSDCSPDFDTFIDSANGMGCPFYKGKDCLSIAQSRGISYKKSRELLMQCPEACGYCGPGTIVKECEDDSCECKDTPGWSLSVGLPALTCATQTTQYACASEILDRGLTDLQARMYLSNCARSCQTCRPCSNIIGVGDKVCDPGNNNAFCVKTDRNSGVDSEPYDGGDCCNIDDSPFFDEFSDNSLRYKSCLLKTSAFRTQNCRCLAPGAPRKADCAGAYPEFGPCSITCERKGIKTRVFTVLQAATAGGHACEANDGDKDEQPCGNINRVCPVTTSTTRTSTTTTTVFITQTTIKTSAPKTTGSDDGGSTTDDSDDSKPAVKDDNNDAVTATTTIPIVVCLIKLLL